VYVQHNTEVRSRNKCCHGKVASITHLCVCARAYMRVPRCAGVCMHVRACSFDYPACNSYAPYCDITCLSLKRRSTADRLLVLWVRIPPVAWMFVLCVVGKDKRRNAGK
jgi:hypothetical protein